MAMLFITHDLGIVRKLAERVCVMKAGKIVEHGPIERVFSAPEHPYTRALIAAEPRPDPAPVRPDAPIVLETQDLKVWFPIKRGFLRRVVGHIKAVDGVSIAVRQGETLGIVGESGSGKTTLGLAILRLISSQGRIVFLGKPIAGLKFRDMLPFRRDMQIVFQDPYGSLSPRMSVSDIIEEGLRVHSPKLTRAERDQRVIRALADVGLDTETRFRYPHEFSGGQRQRIALARAVVLEPTFVVLDEPTSALDMLIQSQMVDLLRALQKRRNLTYLFISHDLRVVAALASRLVVMRHGKVVEEGAGRRSVRRVRRAITPARCSPPPSSSRRRRKASSPNRIAPVPKVAPPTDASLTDLAVEVSLSPPELLGKGFRTYERYRYTLPGDDPGLEVRTHDLIRFGRIVAVLPVDLTRDEVVLIRQFRLPAHLANRKGDLVEIVAGHVEAGEKLVEAARRECLEEIGVAPSGLTELFTYLPTPGASDEQITLFLGIVDAAEVPAAPAPRPSARRRCRCASHRCRARGALRRHHAQRPPGAGAALARAQSGAARGDRGWRRARWCVNDVHEPRSSNHAHRGAAIAACADGPNVTKISVRWSSQNEGQHHVGSEFRARIRAAVGSTRGRRPCGLLGWFRCRHRRAGGAQR